MSRHVEAAALAAVFFAALLPYATDFVTYHPDERHYTDAAIVMIDSGDYITPREPDGTLRLTKPILPYWLVLASYELLGIDVFSSRLPFLLAGCATVWLTYQLALLVGGTRETARLSALIAMCNPALIISSPRSTPDALFAVFVLLAIYGFVAIIRGDRDRAPACAAAYLGSGLAVATRGSPGVVFLGFALAFALANPWQRVSWRKLVHVPSMLAGVVIAVGWYVVIYSIHGSALLDALWYDQVELRLDRPAWGPIRQLPAVVGICAATLLPWIVPALAGSGRRAPAAGGRSQSATGAQRFLLAWIVVYMLLAASVDRVNIRYLLPAIPAIAVLLAQRLTNTDRELVERCLRPVATFFAGVLTVLALLVAMITPQLGWRVAHLAAIALAAGAIATLAAARRRGRLSAAAHCGALIVSAMPVFNLAMRPVVLPDVGEAIASSLAEVGELDAEPIRMLTHPRYAARTRVESNGRAEIHCSKGYDADGPIEERIIVRYADASEPASTVGRRYARYEVLGSVRGIPAGEIASAVWKGELAESLRKHRRRFVITIADEPLG